MSDMPDIEFRADSQLGPEGQSLYRNALRPLVERLRVMRRPLFGEYPDLPEVVRVLNLALDRELGILDDTFMVGRDAIVLDIAEAMEGIPAEGMARRQQAEYDTPETAGAKTAQARKVADMFQHVFGRGDGQ